MQPYYLCRMKIFCAVLIPVLFCISCTHPNKEIKVRIANADSVAINYFRGDGTMDTVVAIKIIHDKQKIDQLVNLISAQTAQVNSKCGYDGSLHFFKMNKVVQDIDFRIGQQGCMYFFFTQDGVQKATELSTVAKELLLALRN